MTGRKRKKMNKTLEIYRNYGCLGAEKRIVYTYGGRASTATCSDKITVEIPDGWELAENFMGETIVEAPWGWTYMINEVLRGDKRPCFIAMDKEMREQRIFLKVVEE